MSLVWPCCPGAHLGAAVGASSLFDSLRVFPTLALRWCLMQEMLRAPPKPCSGSGRDLCPGLMRHRATQKRGPLDCGLTEVIWVIDQPSVSYCGFPCYRFTLNTVPREESRMRLGSGRNPRGRCLGAVSPRWPLSAAATPGAGSAHAECVWSWPHLLRDSSSEYYVLWRNVGKHCVEATIMSLDR